MPTTAFQEYACSCPCGETKFRAHAKPFARFHCHCLICQQIYGKPWADVSVLWARALEGPAQNTVRIARYRSPPALNRATCKACGGPVHGVFALGALRTVAFVPSANFAADVPLPAPEARVFYHRRAADVDDHLPKYSGYWRSELAVSMLLFKRMLVAAPR
jgi:hypothetical protein